MEQTETPLLDPTIKVKRGHFRSEKKNRDWLVLALERGQKEAAKSPRIISPRQMVKDFLTHQGKPSVTKALNAYLFDHPDKMLAIARTLVNEAIKGNVSAAQEVMNRIDGKVAEVHRLDAENPVTLVFAPASQMLAQKIETQNVLGGAGLNKEVLPKKGEPEDLKVVSLPLPQKSDEDVENLERPTSLDSFPGQLI